MEKPRCGLRVCAGFFLFVFALPGEWEISPVRLRANLRGVSAVSRNVAWASGTNGTVVRTVDGGAHYFPRSVPSAEMLDFRDIEAHSAERAYVMSAGPGSQSRVYKTEDGGERWELVLENPDKDGFFDAIAFWDERRGLVLGDPVGGRFTIRRTEDGGAHWSGVEAGGMPAARAEEAAFAASGTCLIVQPGGRAWFVTGGVGGGRVFHSSDWGVTWRVEETTALHKTASSGLFSIAANGERWIAAGGDYRLETSGEGNLVVAGKSVSSTPPIYLSAVVYRTALEVLASGPRGTFLSVDAGASWQRASDEGFHTMSVAAGGTVYAAGAGGRIARWTKD